jgi:nicotinate-nucleotide pyrophosphorylase (carboxylating)
MPCFGRDDAVMIRDSHIAVAGGTRAAEERVRAGVGHLVKTEVGVDALAQLDEALGLRVDTVLLDNMTLDVTDMFWTRKTRYS